MVKKGIEQKEADEKALIHQYFGDTTRGFFVEVGANEPASLQSQTWHRERSRNAAKRAICAR